MNSLISIIIPVYCGEQYIEETVYSALNQTWRNIEVILIDDASTDDTWSILKKLAKADSRVRLLRNEQNTGVAGARNRAIAEAQGTYIALLDSDDLWLPQKLEIQMQLVIKTNCDFCYTAYTPINERHEVLGKKREVPESISFQALLLDNVIGCSTVLCRADIMQRHPMREDYAHEDYVLWLELLRGGYYAAGVKDSLMEYRIHSKNRSRNKRKAAVARWLIYRNFLKMGIFSSIRYFIFYVINGLHKSIRYS